MTADDSDNWDCVKQLIEEFAPKVAPTVASHQGCEHDNVFVDEGNYICSACNTLVCRYIDQGAEWRFYGWDDNKSGSDPTRCGLPTSDLIPGSGLGTTIGYGNNLTYGDRVMRQHHMWNNMTYQERALYNIFDRLQTVANNSGVPKSILDQAKTLYKKVSETKITRGDNREGIIAACIYMACKQNDVPRSASEIAKAFNIKECVMTRGCKKYQELMKINVKTTKASDFINRFCSKLDLSTERKNICRHVVDKAEELAVVSKNTPPSIAAGSIFMCSNIYNWGITKKMLADACDISQVTIGKCSKKMELYRELILLESQ